MNEDSLPSISLTVADSDQELSFSSEFQTAGQILSRFGMSNSNSSANPHLSGMNCRSVYIHIPFCFHKCHYCDFYSVVDHQDRQEQFTRRLIRELNAYTNLQQGAVEPHPSMQSIFIGGGTPTLLAVEWWNQLLPALHDAFHITPSTEFTVEANPETMTPELAHCLAEGGVNRMSVGAQSFNSKLLKTLERWHDPDHVAGAIDTIRSAGIENINLDLIFAIPGETMGDWLNDLNRALALNPTHLSCYSLTYEPGTALTARHHAGEFPVVDEDVEAEMFLATRAVLSELGFEAYEISNFEKNHPTKNYQCKHNLAYWRGENWLAFGPAASGHLRPFRWKNIPHLARYLDPSPDSSGFPLIQDVEEAGPTTQLTEQMLMGFRLKEGLARDDLLKQAEVINRAEALSRVFTKQIDSGRMVLLKKDREMMALSEETGILLTDTVIGDLIEAIQ